jgi:ABC-type transport system involved in cytochrome c biogenesis permease subunit
MRYKLLFTLFILIFIPSSVKAAGSEIDLSDFGKLPVLHEGRVKPLDTLARNYLTSFHGKDTIEGLSSLEWIAEVLFNPQKAYSRQCFNISNPDVLHAIGLSYRKEHRYSFLELTGQLSQNTELLGALQAAPPETLSIAQKQLMDVYINSLYFYELSRSLSLILPEFILKNESLSNTLNLEINKPYSYIELIDKKDRLASSLETLINKPEELLTQEEKELLGLGQQMIEIMSTQHNILLKPTLIEAEKSVKWASLWEHFHHTASSNQLELGHLLTWNKLALAYQNNDQPLWDNTLRELQQYKIDISSDSVRPFAVELEYYYNNIEPFQLSLICYLICFLLVIFSNNKMSIPFEKFVTPTLLSGAIIHLLAIISRVFIMQRPPVATLYESIIFVGLIVVLCCLFLEHKKKNGIAALTGSSIGLFLLTVASKYSAEGDTMSVLVAVLNTNFWLSTHVICITIGYGFCLIAAFFGHIYLLTRFFHASDKNILREVSKLITGTALIALLFSIIGTILGGIWADQSWGRFWGWDPKENGAMLICLWLIMVLHGKITGIAWFGVNLLNVGLHSYGFTENIALNLALFCISELLIISICSFLIWKRDKTGQTA